MTEANNSNDPYGVSAEEMRGWLQREIADIEKAKELRVKEASGFVDAFAEGKISQDQLHDRIHEYSCRWGEPLPGVMRSEGLSDKQILARVNKTRVWQGALEPGALHKRDPGSKTPRR